VRIDTGGESRVYEVENVDGQPAVPLSLADDPEPPVRRTVEGATLAAIVSLLLTVLGTLTLSVGVGLMWGLGAGLSVGGAVMVVVGVLLGTLT
jgi:predicted RND superfamily exporter protein